MLRFRISQLAYVMARNICVLALLALLGFALPRFLPGSPLQLGAEDSSAHHAYMSRTVFERYTDYYAPEKSLPDQFRLYISNLIRGDLGYSFNYGVLVSDLLLKNVGWTLLLTLTATLVAMVLGVPLGYAMAVKGRGYNFGVMTAMISLQAVPAFLLAIVAQLTFSYALRWFPAQGAYPVGMRSTDPGFLTALLRHAILPIIVLALSYLPSIVLLTRNVSKRISQEPYVEVARYNNVPAPLIWSDYVLRNSLPELLARLNMSFLYAISGAVFVEMVFSYPGLGTLLRTAIGARDYTLIQGIYLVVCVYSFVVNTTFELIQLKVDPRTTI